MELSPGKGDLAEAHCDEESGDVEEAVESGTGKKEAKKKKRGAKQGRKIVVLKKPAKQPAAGSVAVKRPIMKRRVRDRGVEVVHEDDRKACGGVKQEVERIEELLRDAKTGARKRGKVVFGWEDGKGRLYGVMSKSGAVLRSAREGERWYPVQEKDRPVAVSVAAERERCGTTTIEAKEEGRAVMAKERQEAGRRLKEAWDERKECGELGGLFFRTRAEVEEVVSRVGMEMFTDGTGGDDGVADGSAGWGVWMAGKSGRRVECAGRAGTTNNHGELRAIGEACAEACRMDDRGELDEGWIVVRFDSEYAALNIAGVHDGTANKEEIKAARRAVCDLMRRRTVKFMHVKGHSGNTGNNAADAAADKGKERGSIRREWTEDGLWRMCEDWDMAEVSKLGWSGASVLGKRGTEHMTEERRLVSSGAADELAASSVVASSTSSPVEKSGRGTRREDRRRAAAVEMSVARGKVDGALWNVNGIVGMEADVCGLMEELNVGFVVVVEPKETVTSFRARLGAKVLDELGVEVCGVGRDQDERGGGVWILSDSKMVEMEREWDERTRHGKEEVTVARLRKKGAKEWTVVIGVYVTPNHKKKGLREETLMAVQQRWTEVEARLKKEKIPVEEVIIMGDLNMKLDARRRKWVDGRGDGRDAGETVDDQQEKDVRMVSYTKEELSIVRGWTNKGMVILNGRHPYDAGRTTRKGSCAILDYVMTNHPGRVWRLENVEREGSDHNVVVLRRRMKRELQGAEEMKEERKRAERDAEKEVTLGDVRWGSWGEADIERYNDLLGEWGGDADAALEHGEAAEVVDQQEKGMRDAIAVAAVRTEVERRARVKGELAEDEPFFLELRTCKARRLAALRRWEKEPSSATREEERAATREWKKEWRRVTRRLAKQRTAWFSMMRNTQGGELWKELEWAEGEKKCGRNGPCIVMKEDGEMTADGAEAVETMARWCKKVSLKDWAEEQDVEFDEEYGEKAFWFHEWRGVAMEERWRRGLVSAGDEEGVLKEVCEAQLMDCEIDWGMKRGRKGKARGSDELPNEAVMFMDWNNKDKVARVWRIVWDAQRWPTEWKKREVVYQDKKGPSRDLDKKRGLSMLACMGKKFGQAVSRRLGVIIASTVSRTQGAARRRGCLRQVGAVAQIVGSRLRRNLTTIGVLIDLRKAFDTVDHKLLRAMLRRRGVHGRLLENVWRKYEGRMTRVKARDSGKTVKSEWWQDHGRGVTQGGVDSMDLFEIMVDELECELIEAGVRGVDMENGGARWRLAMYADDVILMAASEDDAQRAVEVADRYYRRWGLVTNPAKCEVIVWRQNVGAKPRLILNKQMLEVKKEAVYLGVVLHEKGTWRSHKNRRSDKAAKWRWKVRSVARKRGGAPIGVAEMISKGGEVASLLFAGELWADWDGPQHEYICRRQIKKDIEMLGLPKNTPGVVVRDEAGDDEWAMGVLMRKLELVKRLISGERDMAGEVARERLGAWKQQRSSGGQESEYDWIGNTLQMAESMAMNNDEKRAVDAWSDEETGWAEVQGALMKMVRCRFAERHARMLAKVARMQEREYAGKVKWDKRWTEARGGLVTDDVSWVSKARCGVLRVEEETGRWTGVKKTQRRCEACGAMGGTAEHLVDRCKVGSDSRSGLLDEWTKRGWAGTSVWTAVMDPSRLKARSVEDRQWVIRTLNATIGRLMRVKAGGATRRVGDDDSDTDSVWRTTQDTDVGPSERPRGTRGGTRTRTCGSEGEICHLVQTINVAELRVLVDETMNNHERRVGGAVLRAARGGRLTVEYRRATHGGGRWYARSAAQLQSCARSVRNAALRGVGIEIDMRASYPTIVLNMLEKARGARGDFAAIAKYVRDTDEARRQVAEEYDVAPRDAKACFNRVMFGGSIDVWKRARGVSKERRSGLMERFAWEMARARVLVAEARRSSNPGGHYLKDSTEMAKAVEKEEERLMSSLRARMEERGWRVGSLIHDAIVVERRGLRDEAEEVAKVAMEAAEEWCDREGWRRSGEGGPQYKVTMM